MSNRVLVYRRQSVAIVVLGDAPGAPSTFATNQPRFPGDMMNPSWSTSQNLTNSYYPTNPVAMSTAPNASYDPSQYGQMPLPTAFHNPAPHGASDDRSSRKVHFVHQPQHQAPQQHTISRSALGATQSWHEPSVNSKDTPILTKKHDSNMNSQFMNQSVTILPLPSSFQATTSVPKPIYVGIDHGATLAERGQTVGHKRARKSREKTTTEEPNPSSRRERPHGHQPARNPDINDVTNTKTHTQGHRPLEFLQAKVSGSQRPGTTTTSTSTVTPNKLLTPLETTTTTDREQRSIKARGARTQSAQQVEQQSLVHNELLPSRSNRHQPQSQSKQQAQQQRSNPSRNDSPARVEATATGRRVEKRNPGSPMMRIPIAQQQKQRQRIPGAASTPPSVTRTRV